MKAILASAIFLLSSSAFAAVRNPVFLGSVFFDGANLNVDYRAGGGCQKHRGSFDIELKPTEKNHAVAIVTVVDESDVPDTCKSFIFGRASVNLKERINDLVKDANSGITSVEVVLPKLNFTVN